MVLNDDYWAAMVPLAMTLSQPSIDGWLLFLRAHVLGGGFKGTPRGTQHVFLVFLSGECVPSTKKTQP